MVKRPFVTLFVERSRNEDLKSNFKPLSVAYRQRFFYIKDYKNTATAILLLLLEIQATTIVANTLCYHPIYLPKIPKKTIFSTKNSLQFIFFEISWQINAFICRWKTARGQYTYPSTSGRLPETFGHVG